MKSSGRAAKLAEARSLFGARRFVDAIALIEPLIRIDPRNPELLSFVARCRNGLGQHIESIALATRSLAVLDHPEALLARGDSLRAIGRTDEAIADIRRAIGHAPDSIDCRIALVATLEEAGREDDARVELGSILSLVRHQGESALPERVAYEHAKLLIREGRFAEAVQNIDSVLPRTERGSIPFLMLLFLRAKALDQSGDFEQAWNSALRAQESRRVSFDPDALVRATDEAIAWWTPERIAAIGDSGFRDQTPVFVAGMPRSGTSLVDQIVHSHPLAAGVGELDSVERWAEAAGLSAPSDHARIARQYLEEMRSLAPGKLRVVNKALGNARIAGHLARTFPGARILHVVRDPRDVAVSCVMGAFGATRYPWTTRPEWVAAAWQESERLMAHWRRVLHVPIQSLSYEALVTQGEPCIRRIFEFLGLEWSDRVMRFHESSRTVRTLSYDQVSRPLYGSSIGRWRNYSAALGRIEFPSYRPPE
jgi:Flp pilus assembly protein TadD